MAAVWVRDMLRRGQRYCVGTYSREEMVRDVALAYIHAEVWVKGSHKVVRLLGGNERFESRAAGCIGVTLQTDECFISAIGWFPGSWKRRVLSVSRSWNSWWPTESSHCQQVMMSPKKQKGVY